MMDQSRRGGMRARSGRIVWILLTGIAVISRSPQSPGQDSDTLRNPVTAATGDTAKESSLASLKVLSIESALQVGADRNHPLLRLAALVRLTNESAEPLTVSREQFSLLVNEQAAVSSLPESNPSFPSVTLKASESADGWVWFSQIAVRGIEPGMVLIWSSSLTSVEAASNQPSAAGQPTQQPQVSLSVNKAIRDQIAASPSRLGPDDCLLRIAVHGNLDAVAIWPLSETLRAATRDEVERVLIVPLPESQPVVTDEFVTWLSALMERSTGEPAPPTPFMTDQMRFKHLAIGGIPQSANRRFSAGRGAVRIHESVSDALCEAVAPVYRRIPVDRGLQDLTSPESGLRRAALAGIADRLTDEQAVAVLQLVRTSDEQFQAETAGSLKLFPGSQAIASLRELVLNGTSAVARIALVALSESHDPAAATTMAEIWRASAGSAGRQQQIISVLIESRDERWTPLLTGYLRDVLEDCSRDPGLSPSESSSSSTAMDRSPVDASMVAQLSRLLTVLQDQNPPGITDLLRSRLLQVRQPELQDILLHELLESDRDQSEPEIRKCIEHRLRHKSFSPQVFTAAASFRDPDWTPQLLQCAKMPEAPGNGVSAMQAAVACSTPEQLSEMLTSYADLPREHQELILVHASQTGHLRWRELAAAQLIQPGPLSSTAIMLLGQDASEESLQLLTSRLELYVADLEGTADASIDGQRFFHALITQVSLFPHPDCRRLMNQLARDENSYLSDVATRRLMESSRRSPAFNVLEAAHRSRMSGHAEEELQLLNLAVQLDPLHADVFTRRASALMHSGQFADAREDLKVASRLSPQELEVLSLTALVQIRLGQIDEGLKQAEEAIALAPHNWVSLYNGACAYARAADSSATPDSRRPQLADRAIQLLHETASRSFSDVEHLLKDPDLAGIHTHVMWPELVKQVTANKLPRTAALPTEPN